MSIQNSVNAGLGSLSALGIAKSYFEGQKESRNLQQEQVLNQKQIIQDNKMAQIKANQAAADDMDNRLLSEAEGMQKYREDFPEDSEGYEELVNQLAQEHPGIARIWEQQTKVPYYITENAVANSQAVKERWTRVKTHLDTKGGTR